MKYIICIPTYNEAENIGKLLRAILNQKLRDFDILVIDDSSPDGTAKIVKKTPEFGKNIFLMERTKKEGLGKAYIAGFKWALQKKYDYILGMDADFSHDPKHLKAIIEKSKNYDVVIGSRYIDGGKIIGWKWYRYLNSWGANLVTRILLGLKPKDTTSGYRCYSAKFLSSLDLDNILAPGYAFLVEMVNLAQENGFSIFEVPITFVDRREGQSKISGELKRSVKTIIQLSIRKKIYRQLVKFAIIGISGTIIDFGVLNILAVLLKFNVYLSAGASFVLAATNNFYWNRKWTFKDQKNNKKIQVQYFQYIIIMTIGFLLNLIILRTFLPYFGNLFNLNTNSALVINLSKVIATIVVTLWNFIGSKKLVFAEQNENRN
jgi:dolichol-phosphate mannosyltransferase